MNFDEWWNETEQYDNHGDPVKAAWDHQQKIIDGFKQANNDLAKAAIRPDGYVLVPVEPTEKMIDAWYSFKAMDEYANINDMWEVMIEAAQEED